MVDNVKYHSHLHQVTPLPTDDLTYILSFILDCSGPLFHLVPSASSLSTPLKFRPNQNIYISLNIDPTCLPPSPIITQWTILTCPSLCSNQTQFNQPIDISTNNLFIPARTLSNGIYEFKVTVSMIDYPAYTSTSSIYIEIGSFTLITNLVSFGASMITHHHQDNLTFDPGTFSFNLNPIPFNKTVCHYHRKYFQELFLSKLLGLVLFLLLSTLFR